ncbi:polysaccharide biosynthesis C-terminal domain-containing protein [Pararhizobium sp. DWP3-4]|uniref:oligosaccharide flippase family protein n=1 Tax=Pararhizobium sp. DWP3-4 TaxID=2804565 RepID=UPI003CE961D2
MGQFARQSLYSAASGLATVFASFTSGVIIANLLGVHGAGMVAFAVWIAAMLAPIIDGGTALSVGRFPAELRGQDNNAAAHALPAVLARRLLLYHLFGVTALAAFCSIGTDVTLVSEAVSGDDIGSRIPLTVVLVVAALTSLQSFALFGTSHLRSAQSFRTLATLACVSMFLQIGAVYIGAHFNGVVGALAGYAVGQVCFAAAALSLIFRSGKVSPALTSEVWRYGRFSWAANVCNTFVWSRIEILFLQVFWSYREVGWFSVALALSGLASQGPLLLTGAFLPMLARKHGQDDKAGLQSAFTKGTRLLATIALPTCLGMAAVVPGLVTLLYGPEFEPAVPAAMIIVTAAAFTITTVIGSHLVNALGRSDFIFFSSLSGALLSTIFGFLLIPDFGLVGAAISRAIVQLAMVAIGLWFITAQLGFSFPFGAFLRILLASLAAAGAAFVTIGAIGHPAGLFAAIAVAAFTYVLCLRLFGATNADDIALVRRLSAPLPQPFARMVGIILSFIHPGSLSPTIITTTR